MRKFSLFFLLIFISGCVSAVQESKTSLIQEQKLEDLKTCKYYGFKEGTSDLNYCLMKLDIIRKQLLLKKKILQCENVRRDNSTIKGTGFWGGVLMGMRENLACD